MPFFFILKQLKNNEKNRNFTFTANIYKLKSYEPKKIYFRYCENCSRAFFYAPGITRFIC